MQRCCQLQLGTDCWVLEAEKGMSSFKEAYKEVELKIMTKWDLLKRGTVMLG